MTKYGGIYADTRIRMLKDSGWAAMPEIPAHDELCLTVVYLPGCVRRLAFRRNKLRLHLAFRHGCALHTLRSATPEHLNFVLLKRPIGSQQHHVLAAGLGDQHAVERIAMMRGQVGHGEGMRVGHGQSTN